MEIIQFKIIFRGWLRNKIYAVISILSLVVGLVCSVLLIGFVMNEYRIAQSVTESDSFCLLQEESSFYNGTKVITNTTSTGSYAMAMQQYFPEVEDHCVFHVGNMQLMTGDKLEYMEFLYEVSSTFPDFFKPVVVAGNLKATLSSEAEMAVTASFAKRRFGNENPIGQELKFRVPKNVITDEGFHQIMVEKKYTVTSVIDDTQQGFLHYELLTGLPDEAIDPSIQGWTNSYYTFLKLGENVSSGSFENRLIQDTIFTSRYRVRSSLHLLPMNEVYFSNDKRAELIINRDKSLLYVGMSVALAILVIACFNYINISMTRTLQRLRTTGQQLVFGASRLQVMMQLVLETTLQVLIALGIALFLILRALPVFNGFMESHLMLSDIFSGQALWVLFCLFLLIILLPSLYIFLRLNSVSLNDILKQVFRRRSQLITGMVIAQFTVSAILLIVVMNIRHQMNFIAHSRPGSENIISLDLKEEMDRNTWALFKEQLLSIPEVIDHTSGAILYSGAMSTSTFNAVNIYADQRYFDFFGMKVLQGRTFVDGAVNKKEVVVNETLVKKRKLDHPIGHTFEFNGENTIIGVVSDFNVDHFSREIQPLIIEQIDGDWKRGWATIVKIKEGMMGIAIDKIQELWKKISPAGPVLCHQTMAQIYLNLHKGEQRIMQVVSVFTWISLLLTCLGLFGLAWYSVENRTKEIGLRRINGASEGEIILLLCRRFITWIFVALVIALPVAWYLTNQWLMQFVYKADMTALTFVGCSLFVIIVGMVTVIWQSWRAAIANPVESLKQD